MRRVQKPNSGRKPGCRFEPLVLRLPRREARARASDEVRGTGVHRRPSSLFWSAGRLGETACGKALARSSGQMRTEAVDRAEKSELVSGLNQVFSDTGVVVVAHYSGLNVAQMTALRGRMRDAGASLKVAKNRLVKLALKGTDVEHISDLFQGATVIAYSKDPGRRSEGRRRIRQDERQVRPARRRHGADQPGRQGRRGARRAAVAR